MSDVAPLIKVRDSSPSGDSYGITTNTQQWLIACICTGAIVLTVLITVRVSLQRRSISKCVQRMNMAFGELHNKLGGPPSGELNTRPMITMTVKEERASWGRGKRLFLWRWTEEQVERQVRLKLGPSSGSESAT